MADTKKELCEELELKTLDSWIDMQKTINKQQGSS
jgi:hypothetical protein